MNLKTTLALLVVLLAIGGAAWWLGRPDATAPEPGTATAQSRQPLLPPQRINLNRLTQIEIQQPGSTCVLENTDSGWRMSAPVNAPINPAAITELQSVLGLQSYMPGEEERLDKPADKASDYAIALRANDQHVTVQLSNVLGGGYCRATLEQGQTQTRYTTEIALHHLLANLDPSALLASRLDTPTALTAQRIEIASAAGDLVLRKVDGRWYLGETGTDQRALSVFLDGYTSVPGYLNIPGAADIVQYLPLDTDNPAALGLDRPRAVLRYTLSMTDNEGQPKTAELRIGSPADLEKKTYFVSYRGPDSDRPIYCVLPWDYAAVLARPADDFRDPRVMEIQPGLVARIKGTGFGSDFEGDLRTVDPAFPGRLENFLKPMAQSIAAARATGYMPTDQLTAPPIATLTIDSILGDTKEDLRIYADIIELEESTDPSVLVVRNDEAYARRIPAKTFKLWSRILDGDPPPQ